MSDFSKLGEVYRKAREAGVDFELHYNEGADTFYFTVSSVLGRGCFVGKDHSFDIAVECVVEWLERLKRPVPKFVTAKDVEIHNQNTLRALELGEQERGRKLTREEWAELTTRLDPKPEDRK